MVNRQSIARQAAFMSSATHSSLPWSLCFHLRSHENDQACGCGYRGSIWSEDDENIICEMGSSPDVDGAGQVQGHMMPMADRPTQLADARYIVMACNAFPDLVEALERITEHYCDLINSGDCGSWNPETEDIVKEARAVLSRLEGNRNV